MVDIPPALDRATAYGDGLFETMLAVGGALPLLSYHRARLSAGIAQLTGELEQDALWQRIADTAKNHSGIIKLNCFRSGGPRGYAAAQSQWQYHIQTLPAPRYPQRYLQQGVVLQPLPQRLAFEPNLAAIKHTNRLAQVQASSLLDKTFAQDALMFDSNGWLIEGLIGNIALVKDGEWITPALDGAGVAGTMRAFLLDQIETLGLRPVVRPIAAVELASAEAIFLSNSILGVWPVRQIGLAPVTVNLALTQALWQLLAPLGYLAAYD